MIIPPISSSPLDSQNPLSHTITRRFFALDTAVLITFRPMGVSELVNLKGTSLEITLQSATLSITVSHSLPWEPWTVMTQSLYLLGTLDLSREHWTEYGVSTHTSFGSGDSALSSSATILASASFSLFSLWEHRASKHAMSMSLPSAPVSPLR